MSTLVAARAATVSEYGGAVTGVANAHATWSSRRGLLLRLAGADGDGLGEASPLPGYSPDDLAGCRRALEHLDPARLGLTVPADGAIVPDELAAVLAPVPFPAARFAVETALLDLAARRLGQPLWRLYADLYRQLAGAPDQLVQLVEPAPVAVNAVCTELDPVPALAAMERAWARGVRCVKLKVGRDPARELAVLQTARRSLGPELGLRVDANGAWSVADARVHLGRMAEIALEYVEEPVRDPRAHLAALTPAPIPIALDESLQPSAISDGATSTRTVPAGTDAMANAAANADPDSWPEPALRQGLAQVLILKPMLLGGALAAL
ncbi:mandelate racemase/muconate lactonizing enzyme family protein, partial [Haliangium sp.]|uniref:mandelate racemase/muconate lactonizing enzyme family protein n=1 Tax=Haliangium sp. TaxID=2663208 RepID=UPI003D11EAD7